jgi:hypothetical protein
VDSHRANLKQCGLIADRLFILKTINANGKSFIAVSANQSGGLGVAIALRQNLAIGLFVMMIMI